MFAPTKVIDVDLGALEPVDGLDGYERVRVLVRLHGVPLGHASVVPIGGRVTPEAVWGAFLGPFGTATANHLLADTLATSGRGDLDPAGFEHAVHPAPAMGTPPLVTVAVCTRDRPDDLARCLAGLEALRGTAVELLVVDNAPSSDATARLVREHPRVRYVCEPRPGLDWARNRAIEEARGDVIAFTDDDAVVDPDWAAALARAFGEHPDVACVTGLVVPLELETEAQSLFEQSGGFGRGYEARWFRAPASGRPIGRTLGGASMFGTGANMAFRRSLFDEVGRFDPALDVGTVTCGGGDLDLFFRVLKAGHTLMYEPGAIVRHRHRRDLAGLRGQLRSNGIGLFSYFVRNGRAYPEERWPLLRLGFWWLGWWHLRRLARAILHPAFFPKGLIWAELWGSIVGLGRYRQSRAAATALGAEYPPVPRREPTPRTPWTAAVRTVHLEEPIAALPDVADRDMVRLFVFRAGRPLGSIDVLNERAPVSARRLRETIAGRFSSTLLATHGSGAASQWRRVLDGLTDTFVPGGAPHGEEMPLDPAVPVSIVVATCDRPDDLRRCLASLRAASTPRPVEIIVVDNRPDSGLTPPVVAEFPGVRLVVERRAGVSYARNAGFVRATSPVIVSVDDDVTVPPHWLETLLAPLARPDVMIATGPLFPVELETEAQLVFETYGGLGRGFERVEADGRWYTDARRRSVPTWLLGGTANAAFRADIFADPRIGLLDEALGPGTPTGVGEDTYVFYKVLRAGFTIVYDPAAYAWHRHRRTMTALRRQIYNYSKGHVAYHLTTLVDDGDMRALLRLLVGLPLAHVWRAVERLRGRSGYTLLLLGYEICGNLVGPFVFWSSRRRVRRLGRSEPWPAPAPEAASVAAGRVAD